MKIKWPKRNVRWIKARTLYVSIPFTWELPVVKNILLQKSFEWDSVIVGGPAVCLQPNYFSGMEFVSIGYDYPGVLQFINPLATRTTTGCPNKCGFCGVRTIEPKFKQLEDWPDLPILCDNNLLASSQKHFDKVVDRLIAWGWANFNQGLDSRLLTDYHAMRIAEIKKPMIYLALDSLNYSDEWACAYDRLRSAGVNKSNIRSYALIGFNSDPSECWQRCGWIEKHGIKAMPMWYHELDAIQKNIVTQHQYSLGWDDYERRNIMGYFYQHRYAVVN